MTENEIQRLRRKIYSEAGRTPHHRRMAFIHDKEGDIVHTHIYWLDEDTPVDDQNNAIINGKKFKVLSFRDTMMFYLQDLCDTTVRYINEIDNTIVWAGDTRGAIIDALDEINDLMRKIIKNMEIINDVDQTIHEWRICGRQDI